MKTADIQKEFTKETGIEVFYSQDDLNVEYLFWLEKKLASQQRLSEETESAIVFILENSCQNDYISDNIEHFVNGVDDAYDNSIESGDYWMEQFKIVETYLKNSITPIKKDALEDNGYSFETGV